MSNTKTFQDWAKAYLPIIEAAANGHAVTTVCPNSGIRYVYTDWGFPECGVALHQHSSVEVKS